MAIRATGDNEEMVRASSINADVTKCIGFAMANACIALAGGLVCQYNQSADTGYGSGMLVVGLASVLASDAFFPFDDCVTLAAEYGVKAIVQPGGSVRDADSVKKCDELGITMLFTGERHFKH